MLTFTPAARHSLQLMDAGAANALSKRAEKVARALNRKVVGKEVLEIAALATDEAIDAMEFTEER